jgi:hypothetical protein
MQTQVHAPAPAKPVATFGAARSGLLQRRCAGGSPGATCPDREKETAAPAGAGRLLRRAAGAVPAAPGGSGAPGAAPPIVHDVLNAPGRPLDGATRTFMESRFGHDFGRVRVHADAQGAESARAVGANAYTVGPNVVFGAGQYQSDTTAGRQLLAHELAHVLQQGESAALQTQLEVGSAEDSAERDADRIAEQVVAGGQPAAHAAHTKMSVAPAPAVLRRQPTTPQGLGEANTRKHTLPAEQRGADQVQIHVLRTLVACPCRQVDDTRTGIFYNPDLDNLAIAYRYCRGGTTADVYGQLQSNATAFLQGQAPPTGTARAGIDVNVVGRVVGGRVVVEALGTNQGGQGIGGRAQIVFQGGQWRVFLEPQFIRRLQDQAGDATPNELQVSLGGQIGDVTVRVDLNDLLDPTGRSGRGSVSVPAGGTQVGPFIDVSQGGGVTVGVQVGVPLGGPEVRKEECRQCFCPPPTRQYKCFEDVLPRDEPVREEVPVERQRDLRYYFRLDRTMPAEDPALRAQSDANLAEVASQVRAGGSVNFIFGYASPEATERHNADLSLARATRLRELIQARVGTNASLPEPTAGGELLGRRPSPAPSSHLGDAIHQAGFRSAEDISIFLLGEVIPNEELARQFHSLVAALPEPADRLALFGLTPDDPIAQDVLDAVGQFERSGGRGHRPWERVFRPLRYAVARVSRTEMVEQVRIEHHSGSLDVLPDSRCQEFAAQAEAANGFGPIDPAALRPTTSTEESNDDCLIRPQDADVRRGCRYELPASFRRRATAPSMAPRELP